MHRKQYIEDYQQHFDLHRDYFVLMEEYSSTELFKEMIHFMDLAFPEWTSNKGVGGWAAEFMLSNINELESFNEKENYSSLNMLKDCYLSLADDYEKTKIQYSHIMNELLIAEFNNKFETELIEKSSLLTKEYDEFYDLLFKDFQEKSLNKITYNFDEFELSK